MMEDTSTIVQFPGTLRVAIDLLIVHPTMHAGAISSRIGLEPHWSHSVGEQRRTSAGTRLPGRHEDTRWRHTRLHRSHSQHFLSPFRQFLESLTPHDGFFAELLATGGKATVIVNFLGDGHYGDNLPREVLAKLVALNLDLGIECYSTPQS